MVTIFLLFVVVMIIIVIVIVLVIISVRHKTTKMDMCNWFLNVYYTRFPARNTIGGSTIGLEGGYLNMGADLL